MVIQIPNPLLLPQSYGMGEIAGMAFGSNYVIMMQIGYRYYAPRIIEEMEKDNLDNPLGTVWWNKWQKFMKIYSDKSITNTMDRTLEMPEQALKAIWDKIFNILPSGEGDATLTSGSGADDDITFVRRGSTTTRPTPDEIEKERARIAANAARARAPTRTITAQGLTKADKINLNNTILNQQKKVDNLNQQMRIKLEQVKAIWAQIQDPANKGFSSQLKRLQWDKDKSKINQEIGVINQQVALLNASILQLKKNLAGAGGLPSQF